MADRMTVTMINHVGIDIAAASDAVWGAIVEDYVVATKFRELGKVDPLDDDPTAPLGGYRLRFEQGGTVVDERIIRFTERDDAAHRLSIFADYLSVPGGMQVFVTYHARAAGEGTYYAIDCHTRLQIDVPASGQPADAAATIADMRAQADVHLVAYLEAVRARVEAGGDAPAAS